MLRQTEFLKAESTITSVSIDNYNAGIEMDSKC